MSLCVLQIYVYKGLRLGPSTWCWQPTVLLISSTPLWVNVTFWFLFYRFKIWFWNRNYLYWPTRWENAFGSLRFLRYFPNYQPSRDVWSGSTGWQWLLFSLDNWFQKLQLGTTAHGSYAVEFHRAPFHSLTLFNIHTKSLEHVLKECGVRCHSLIARWEARNGGSVWTR